MSSFIQIHVQKILAIRFEHLVKKQYAMSWIISRWKSMLLIALKDQKLLPTECLNERLEMFSVIDGGFLKEGLLCPDCKIECKTITELMEAFSTQHQNDRKNSSKINQALFSPSSSSNKQLTTTFKTISIKSSNHQPSIKCHSQMARFCTIRSISFFQKYFHSTRDNFIERYVFETNKLLIRLDKLYQNYPLMSDASTRRQYEQSVVDWLDETVVFLCPFCTIRFNIVTKQKHHCRLCGAVMCAKCSKFLSFKLVQQLIRPVDLDGEGKISPNGDSITPKYSSSRNEYFDEAFPSTKNTRKSSVTDNLLVKQEKNDNLRICLHCESLIMIRKEKMDAIHSKTPIVKLYEELRATIVQMNSLIPTYYRMANSLNYGESCYRLKDANELKQKLIQLGERADLISRNIQSSKIGDSSSDEISSSRNNIQLKVAIQNSIRRSVVIVLRENLLNLIQLPDEERYKYLKQIHDESIEKRIQAEKRLMIEEQIKLNTPSNQISKEERQFKADSSVIDDGYCPQLSLDNARPNSERDTTNSDPIVEQMNIIRSYISQARKDNRYEEVSLLEDNLKQLEIEFFFVQQQNSNQD
ncbi:Rabenosyn-5 [Sarcoptes scabiei]|uniref:Rabenosyn-5 n=1 Tax=Sarcoptes scabiei TaxID=52283 RepID=A0A834VI12_SARSC|nr:Rabenosyn-5 [Sarcoptes scabiei]